MDIIIFYIVRFRITIRIISRTSIVISSLVSPLILLQSSHSSAMPSPSESVVPEQGSHKELMKSSGEYAKLNQAQSQ